MDVDPDTAFIPAQITGRILPSLYIKKPLYLLVAINGVISAVSRTYQDEGGESRFFFMVPEKAFRTGSNQVEILEVSGKEGDLKFYNMTKRTAATYALNQKEFIRSSEGKTFQIVKGAFKQFCGQP